MVEELEMSKGDYESLLLVVDKIYESPFETTGWVDALDELTKFVGCMAADLYISHADAPPVMAHYGFFDDLMEEYLTHYHDQNGRVKAVQAKPTGGMVTDHDVVSRTEMSQSPFYQDFIFKYGYGLNIACAALNEPNESALFGVHYPFGVDPYTTENFRRLELVMPHISRAARLRNRLRISLDREHRLAAAIDKISLGIVLLDRKGEVVQVNAAGERLLAEARGMSIVHRQVRIEQPDLHRAMEQLVLTTIRQNPVEGGSGGAISIGSPASSPALSIHVFPVPHRASREESLGAIVVLSDSHSRIPSTAHDVVRTILELTSAEAQLTIALANGESIASYARRTSRSVETVRSQLKRTMQKTNVSRQSDLVRLTLNSVGFLVDNDEER